MKGVIEYPQLRKTEEVNLSTEDIKSIQEIITKIEDIIGSEVCPARILQSKCRNCSYYDFCWSGESEEV